MMMIIIIIIKASHFRCPNSVKCSHIISVTVTVAGQIGQLKEMEKKIMDLWWEQRVIFRRFRKQKLPYCLICIFSP